MKMLRSLLFVPGNRPNMLDKALGVRPDAYVPDLEDSVPDSEKDNARRVVASYLERLGTAGPAVIPRVNSLHSGLLDDDLAAVVGPNIHGLSIGKIETVDDIEQLCDRVAVLERKTGAEVGSIKLIPWIETALAMVHCYAICSASPRIIGVAFGAEDFTNDMGIERPEDDAELAFARNTVCIAARAAGVAALDTPYFQFRNEDGLRTSVRAGKAIGFKGKFAIHPAQIDGINRGFSPSESEVAYAQRVVAAFEQAERSGRGSTSLDGRVIDVPVVKRARSLLALARSLWD